VCLRGCLGSTSWVSGWSGVGRGAGKGEKREGLDSGFGRVEGARTSYLGGERCVFLRGGVRGREGFSCLQYLVGNAAGDLLEKEVNCEVLRHSQAWGRVWGDL